MSGKLQLIDWIICCLITYIGEPYAVVRLWQNVKLLLNTGKLIKENGLLGPLGRIRRENG